MRAESLHQPPLPSSPASPGLHRLWNLLLEFMSPVWCVTGICVWGSVSLKLICFLYEKQGPAQGHMANKWQTRLERRARDSRRGGTWSLPPARSGGGGMRTRHRAAK